LKAKAFFPQSQTRVTSFPATTLANENPETLYKSREPFSGIEYGLSGIN
jgi:hypothetical protein